MNVLERILDVTATLILLLLGLIISIIEAMDKLAARKARRTKEKVH